MAKGSPVHFSPEAFGVAVVGRRIRWAIELFLVDGPENDVERVMLLALKTAGQHVPDAKLLEGIAVLFVQVLDCFHTSLR